MGDKKEYYLPKCLKDKLSQIFNHSLTLVEAPSGFGKTTAVKQCLAEAGYHSTAVYWYTCLGEPSNQAWEGICKVVAPVDEATFTKIKHLGFPDKNNLLEMIAYIREIACKEQTVLVIDNYQLIRNEFIDAVQNAFFDGTCGNFHVVVITQPLKKKSIVNISNPRKLTIDRSYFFFSKEDTYLFFKHAGILLTDDELHTIWQITEGWVAALCLQKTNYAMKGVFGKANGIDDLIETAVWSGMSDPEKEFLMSLSLFDSFTLKQALILLNADRLPDYARDLLEHNDFIRYDDNSRSFVIHSLLHDYFTKQMQLYHHTAYAKLVYQRAGAAYAALSQHYKAALCYMEIHDYEHLLSLPFTCSDLDDWVGMGSDGFIASVMDQCPRELLVSHPKTLIVFAFEVFLLGKYELYYRLNSVIIQSLSPDTNSLSLSEWMWLSGEFALMTSMTKFNNIALMCEDQKKAYQFIGGPSKILTFVDGWAMGAPSVLYLFHRESGTLQQELASIDECMPYYHKIASGHGTGAEIVMRAEALLQKGDDVAAEILCHKALYLADMKAQNSIGFCVEMCLLRIAVLRGDTDLFDRMTQSIQKRTLAGCESRSKYTRDLIMGFIYLQLDFPENVESWLLDPLELERLLYIPSIPFGQLIYALYLISGGQYAKLIGLSELFIHRAEETGLLLAKIYQLIYVSIAYSKTNQPEAAKDYRNVALSLAKPDGIFLPFAENASKLGLEGTEEIGLLALRQSAGVQRIKNHLIPNSFALSPREREIASLAKTGKTNKEIAALLFVSAETVKMTLKSVFKKLHIHSRVQLETLELK